MYLKLYSESYNMYNASKYVCYNNLVHSANTKCLVYSYTFDNSVSGCNMIMESRLVDNYIYLVNMAAIV